MLKSVVESMGVTGFAQAALLLFFAVFLAVIVRESLRSNREVSRLGRMPLEDAEGTSSAGEK
jgi:hypothetical protein